MQSATFCRGYVDRLSIEHIEKICNALGMVEISELIQLVEK
ncbi:helix-turn-helix domain-containing protein [Lysinibacillus odysseyi]